MNMIILSVVKQTYIYQYACDNIDSKYKSVSNMYWFIHMSVFSQILIRFTKKKFSVFQQFNNEFTLCGCNGRIVFDVIRQKIVKQCMTIILTDSNSEISYFEYLKLSDAILSIYTDLLPP